MRIALAVLAVVVTLGFGTSVAGAQAPGQTLSWDPESTAPSQTAPTTETVSYRSDVLVADGVSLGLVLLGPMTNTPSVSAAGVAGYFLGAPLMHVANGRGKQALQSIGLRVALPIIGGELGWHLGPQDTACFDAAQGIDGSREGGCRDQGSIVGMLLGFTAGGVTAMVIDAKYLARYEKKIGPAANWSASIVPRHGGAMVGVGGAF